MKNGTTEQEPWARSTGFLPYKVPPSLGIDQESLPQANKSTMVGELHYFAPRCQENQVERATFPCRDPQQLQG